MDGQLTTSCVIRATGILEQNGLQKEKPFYSEIGMSCKYFGLVRLLSLVLVQTLDNSLGEQINFNERKKKFILLREGLLKNPELGYSSNNGIRLYQ